MDGRGQFGLRVPEDLPRSSGASRQNPSQASRYRLVTLMPNPRDSDVARRLWRPRSVYRARNAQTSTVRVSPGSPRARRARGARDEPHTARVTETVFAPRYRAMSIGVLMSVSIVAFQALGVGTVMPAVARDLGGLAHYGWAFSAFMLASVVGSALAAGQDTDRAGPVPRLPRRRRLVRRRERAGGAWRGCGRCPWPAGRVLEGLGAGRAGRVSPTRRRAAPTRSRCTGGCWR